MTRSSSCKTLDQTTQQSNFRKEVLAGLTASPKRLLCKHLYDERGSALFDQICELDEYYLTRAELEIMQQHAEEMGRQIGEGVTLVEYGSGSSVKTRILLEHLPEPVAYVPVDISREHLLNVAQELRYEFPSLEVLPVVADFTKPFEVPQPKNPKSHTAVYFPGSTIGNFERLDAEAMLRSIVARCGPGGGLLIGVDLEKDPEVLELAYNDPAGVTAQFNLNLLHRLRNELHADLNLDLFEHVARYNREYGRIEISIRSLQDQTITIEDQTFHCQQGELIHTEYSHKYTVERFSELARRAGLILHQHWLDSQKYFAVMHFVVEDESLEKQFPHSKT